jgi:hypothetical protein
VLVGYIDPGNRTLLGARMKDADERRGEKPRTRRLARLE